MPSALEAAELQHLSALRRTNPGTLLIGTRRIHCGLRPRRGARMEMDGGLNQVRELTALVAVTDLPEDEIQNADASTRAIVFTHIETSLDYRLSTEAGAIEKSPHGQYWVLRATQQHVA